MIYFYTIAYKLDQIDGFGMLKFSNGTVYAGEWKGDTMAARKRSVDWKCCIIKEPYLPFVMNVRIHREIFIH